MKYLIFGNGWLGNMLKEYLGKDADIWIGNIELFYPHHLSSWDQYEWIINTAAKTDIDWCEKNKSQAFKDNVIAAETLAGWALQGEKRKRYAFFSSACIFESKDSYDIKYEDSPVNPQCFYAETKAIAEQSILVSDPSALIIRPRLPISEISHPRNTLDKINGYKLLNDAQESVTVVEDMFPVLKDLMERKESGIFHLINEGTVSPSEIGFLLGTEFTTVTKEEQNRRLEKEGRAKRVTVAAGSNRIPLLPSIQKRMPQIIKNWKLTQ